jgi:hypothetical protein
MLTALIVPLTSVLAATTNHRHRGGVIVFVLVLVIIGGLYYGWRRGKASSRREPR